MLIVAFAKPAENQGMDRFEAAVLRCGLVSGVHLWSPAQARVVSTVRFFLRARAVILRDAVLLGPGRVPIVAIAVARGVRGGRECDDSDRKSRRKSHRDVGWHVHFSSYCEFCGLALCDLHQYRSTTLGRTGTAEGYGKNRSVDPHPCPVPNVLCERQIGPSTGWAAPGLPSFNRRLHERIISSISCMKQETAPVGHDQPSPLRQ